MNARTLMIVGCSNRDLPYFGKPAQGKGIAVLEFDEATGDMTLLSEKPGVDNPHFLEVDEDKLRVYAVSEVWGWNEGVVTAYELDPVKGKLSYINNQPSLGSITCYASLDNTRNHLLVANYAWCEDPDDSRPDQVVVSYPVRADGGLAAPVSSFAHPGSGPHSRQERSHAHFIRVTPDNRFAVVADLGLDKLVVYRFDETTGEISPSGTEPFALPPGSGPRHFVFHPSGKFAYVVNELNSTVVALAFDSAKGSFSQLQVLSALPADFGGESYSADLHASPDGRFLYSSNRGHDSLSIYAVDERSGHLAALGHQPTMGQKPRNFGFDPSGKWIVVANQDGDSLVVLRVDAQTGLLSDTGKRISIGTPMCVLFVRV